MTIQNELKQMRKTSKVGMATLVLQTGIKKEYILASEDAEKEVDLAICFILQDFYRHNRGLEVDLNQLSYADWLDSLNVGDALIVREQTQGTTDIYICSLDEIESINQKKIVLKSKAEFGRETGEVDYYSASGVDFHYKLFPKSDKVNTSKKLAILQKAIELFTTIGII